MQGVSALSEYLCKTAPYPIFIDGTEYSDSEHLLLNYEGTTYAPLKSLLTAAGYTVLWEDNKVIATSAQAPEATIAGDTEAPPATKMTPDGIEANFCEGKYIVFLSDFRTVYKDTEYKITTDKYQSWGLYKNDILLVNNLIMPYKVDGFEYDYYCNIILLAIME